ncbi:MAG: CRISPR-associated protein Cas4 [Bdellovibrionales bacterium]|nr:CRISPR-associated protein Cas4 [Bdellovibrionales bacterium]
MTGTKQKLYDNLKKSPEAKTGDSVKSTNIIPVHLIRQWCYCPRVVYYMELNYISINQPSWVQQGEDFHEKERLLWKRRNLSRFNLDDGKVYQNLFLKSEKLSFHGIVDMAIESSDAVYAVEFKLSNKIAKRKDWLQLTAYAMLLEEKFSKTSPFGFLTGKGQHVLHKIKIDKQKRQEVLRIVNAIKSMLEKGIKPDSSATAVQCCICEYINFCNDRM